MKKMMIIAVMMSVMLMPAQMFAKNDRVNEKPRVENNQKKKEIRVGNDRNNKPAVKPDNKPNVKPNDKPNNKPANKPNNKPNKDYRPNNKPAKPVVVVNRPAPVVVVNNPAPVPPPPPRYYNDNDAADAIANFLSIVGLMAIIAN